MTATLKNASTFNDYDGVICIGGEDWWYHNRGHFDFQIMRRLARKFPVLFINSLGLRMPSLSDKGLFASRVSRKLKSLSRGIVHVENSFYVFSPVSVPGAAGQALSRWALAPQIKLAAARAGITKPLLWIHCPAGASLISEIEAQGLVMQRTDRFESFPEADPETVAQQITTLKSEADLVVYAAPHLMDEEQGTVNEQVLITHGVDFDTFKTAGELRNEPRDVREIPGPRIGFIGGIDAHTFAPELFLETASRLPDAQFVLVGGSSLAEDWCTLPNVHQLGRKPYDDIAHYMAAMDALIMPWNDSSWIEACNPIKLKEYLAVGRPVITTDFPALEPWRDLVSVAKTPTEFAAAISDALATPHDPSLVHKRLENETWGAKADLLVAQFEKIGLKNQAALSQPKAAKAA